MKWEQKTGKVDITKKFKSVAEYTITELEQEIASGDYKKVYKDYVQVINKYLIECLGKYDVHNIGSKELAEITSADDANLVVTMSGSTFSKTTGRKYPLMVEMIVLFRTFYTKIVT